MEGRSAPERVRRRKAIQGRPGVRDLLTVKQCHKQVPVQVRVYWMENCKVVLTYTIH